MRFLLGSLLTAAPDVHLGRRFKRINPSPAVTIRARGRSMSNLASVVQQLKVERDQVQGRLDQLDRALQALDGLGGLPRSGSRGPRLVRTRRTMSAAARRRIAAAQRARWAKWRAGKRAKRRA